MNGIIADILKELENNKHDHRFPVHVVAQAGVVCEASGLLMTEALRMKYQTAEEQERDQVESLKAAAIHTAATAIRFLESLK
jgi:hypothetical protein